MHKPHATDAPDMVFFDLHRRGRERMTREEKLEDKREKDEDERREETTDNEQSQEKTD